MTIAVVDVCSGNLRSVEKALAHAGGDVVVTRDAELVRRADKVVVPGQGAFGAFARGLAGGLGSALREKLATGAPFLGICLGLQVLFEESEEQGPVAGLGLLGGRVVRFRPGDRSLKVPHMGWNRTIQVKPDPLLAGIPDGAYFYFVHSYHVVPDDPRVSVLDCEYGTRFCAAIRHENLFACQFHPEKSQAIGLRLLENFVRT